MIARRFLALALLAIFGATLFPDYGERAVQQFSTCMVCNEHGTSDVLVNVILFFPLGVGLALIGWRGRRAVLAAALLSACVELAQLWIPGRDPSLGDVMSNTLGGLVGFAVTHAVPRWLPGTRQRPKRFILGAAATAAGVIALTGFALGMALPESNYWGQWTANLGHLEWYRGRVLRASLGEIEIPPHRIAGSAPVRTLLLDGAPLSLRAITGPRPRALAPLLSIYDEAQREIVLVGPDRDDLVLRYRTRATGLRMDQPDLRLVGRLRGITPGDTVEVTAWREGHGYCLAVNRVATCDVGFTAGSGWGILLYPEGFAPWLKSLLNAGWLAGLVFPAGFLVVDRRGALLATAVVVAGGALAPSLAGLLPCPPAEWVGMAAGLALGIGLRHRMRGAAGGTIA